MLRAGSHRRQDMWDDNTMNTHLLECSIHSYEDGIPGAALKETDSSQAPGQSCVSTSRHLRYSFSANLSVVTFLEKLWFLNKRCRFALRTGRIPKEIGNLGALTHLTLFGNKLIGECLRVALFVYRFFCTDCHICALRVEVKNIYFVSFVSCTGCRVCA